MLRMLVAVAGTLVVAGYAAVLRQQILVWNPLAAAPGRILDRILAEVAQADESLSAAGVSILAGLGVALAVLVGTAGCMLRWPALRIAQAQLLLVVLGAPAYWVASFGPGMALADTFAIGGGDHAPGGAALQLVSLAALAALIALTARGRRTPAATP